MKLSGGAVRLVLATKRKKTELTGLGAIVHLMMGLEPQLWRDVVAFL